MENAFEQLRTISSSVEMLPPAEYIIAKYEHCEVSQHPLFIQLRSAPVDLGTIWILMANLHESISRHFVPWLSRTISRIEDRRIASLLAKQLNDELGNGDPAQIHSVLLDRFVTALARFRPLHVSDLTMRPAHQLSEFGTKLFFDADPYEAIGALMVGEIFAKKMDRCLGDEIRRQNSLPDESLTWLVIHETLEMDHADESAELAGLLPKERACLAAAWRGADAQWRALWQFLDGVAEAAASSPSL